MTIIEYGLKTRTTGVTGANMDSSRSHAVLQIQLKEKGSGNPLGKISFIDLAGSERAVDTIDINKQTK
jgi:kinesin family protein 2/24